MRVATPRALEFACHSAACRPPTSGGTGGSLSRAQHVAPGHHVDSIMANGLRITPGWAARYGTASYLGFEGDKRSAQFYGGVGRERKHATSAVITGDLKLDNPLTVSGRDEKAIRKDLVAKLGGDEKVAAHLKAQYDADLARIRKIQEEELVVADNADPKEAWADVAGDPSTALYWKFEMGSVQRMDDRIRAETQAGSTYALGRLGVFTSPEKVRETYSYKGSDQNSDVDAMLGGMAKAQGYDALVIHDTHGFTAHVGGNQVVLFDPSKFRPTGVKPVKEFVKSQD